MITRPDFYAALFVLMIFYEASKAKDGRDVVGGIFMAAIATALAFGISFGLGHFIG